MERPHVVMCPYSAPGHTTPFLQFARRLAGEGVVVSIVSSDRHVVEVEKLLGLVDPLLGGVALRLLGLRDKETHLTNAEWRERLKVGSEEEARVIQLVEKLVTDVASPDSLHLRGVQPAGSPICIIYDTFNIWAQSAAKKLHIESHLLWVSPACSLSCSLEAPRLFQDGLLPITPETRDKVVDGIPGLPPTWAMDLPSPLVDPASTFTTLQTRYSHIRQADVIMLNTCYALEKPVLDARSRHEGVGTPDLQAKYILELGPLLPEFYVNGEGGDGVMVQGLEERDPCMLWLNTQAAKSVLFISFGSYATLSARQLLDMALGLEASGCSFLWLVRPPNGGETSAVLGSLVSLVEYLPAGFEERMKGRGMCYSGWAPQMRILKHPAVGGFLSHCGWNSALETVSAGVPLLAWPVSAEQHLIRRCFVDSLKVAIELKGNAYTKEDGDLPRPVQFMSREEIARKTRSLMQEAEGQLVRENIQKLRMQCREAVALGGTSRRNLEAYVRLLTTGAHFRSAPHFSN